MNDLGAGVGTAIEGSLLARALEPQSGAREPHPHQSEHCLNCATVLVGAYCHACGQQAHLHRTLGAFMYDLLHGALHFEGKIWRTLPMLVLRPGILTRRYIEGARARFVSPMALFLFSVFLMFAVFQALGITPPGDLRLDPEVVGNMDEAAQAADEELEDARADLRALPARDPARAAAAERAFQAAQAVQGLRAIGPIVNGNSEAATATTGIGWIDETLIKKWRASPELMLYKLQANSYKFSWLLIPLSLPFLWLLFAWKRTFSAYDHAIFVTYSLSFMSLLFIMISLLSAVGLSSNLLGFAAISIPPLHMYRQLRGAYTLGRFSALWRLIVLNAMILVVVVLFLQILLVLGAL